MARLWFSQDATDTDQEYLVHRQVRCAAKAISILCYPRYPTVRCFSAWEEISTELDGQESDEQESYLYVLLFGVLRVRGAELRVGRLEVTPAVLQRLLRTRTHVHLHLVCDPTLDMAPVPPGRALEPLIEALVSMEFGGCVTVALAARSPTQHALQRAGEASRAGQEDASEGDDGAPDPRSYYNPVMPRFTEIYIRCLVEAVGSDLDLRSAVNTGLEAARATAQLFRLRYQPEHILLLRRCSRTAVAASLTFHAKQAIRRGYTRSSPPAKSAVLPETELGKTAPKRNPEAPSFEQENMKTQQSLNDAPPILPTVAGSQKTIAVAAVPSHTAVPTSPLAGVPETRRAQLTALSGGGARQGGREDAGYNLGEQWGEPRSALHKVVCAPQPLQFNISEFASEQLARRFSRGPKGMVLHIGPFASPAFEYGRKVCPLCRLVIPEEVTWVNHVLTEEHLRVVGNPLPQAQYYCYICGAIVSGDNNLMLHVEGSKHRRKLEVGRRCGCDGCEMLLYTDSDVASHRAACHPTARRE